MPHEKKLEANFRITHDIIYHDSYANLCNILLKYKLWYIIYIYNTCYIYNKGELKKDISMDYPLWVKREKNI